LRADRTGKNKKGSQARAKRHTLRDRPTPASA
jgi:hypothetical protein